MASDRDTLVAEVKLILGNNDSLDARYPTWIRRAYQTVQYSMEFPESQETATIAMIIGITAYALPANFFSIYASRNNTTNTRMIQVSIQEYDQLSTVHVGSVDRYAIFDKDATDSFQTFHVHPSPNAIDTVQIRYRRTFADLVLGTDTHILPDQWDQPLVFLAAAYGLDSQNEIERSAYYRRITAQFIQKEQSRLNENLFDRNEAMSVIGGDIG